MKHLLVIVMALSLGLTGCLNIGNSVNTVKGNGNILTENRQVSGFDRISVAGAGKIVLVKAEEESLSIETDENLLPLIQSSVRGGCLHLGPENVSMSPSRSIHYILKYKHLNALTCSGAIHAEGSQIESESLDLRLSGASSVKVLDLKTDRLMADISGATHVEIGGKAREQKVGLSGASKYQAGNLDSETVRLDCSGASSVTLWVRNHLTAHLSGASSLDYFGAPQHSECHTSGASHVKNLGPK
jgi:hypothetical protein